MAFKQSWTRAERYRPYQEWEPDYLTSLKETIANSIWRLGYHIQPATGLLNDPNGFSYFNHKWHIFYQSYPMGAVHGIKSWYHMTSENLIDWQAEGAKLLPDSPYDSHGVYSGSALPVSNHLFLAYTGNVRDSLWQRHSYQLGAWMNQAGEIKKINTPLIPTPPVGYTEEFRDPQVFPYKDGYLMVIGAQNKEQQGKVLTYSSQNITDWQYIGELDFTAANMGFMIECPNLLLSDAFALLLFCPQGLNRQFHDYQNIYPNTYVIGDSYEPTTNQIVNPTSLKNLDEGFDVYATQAFQAPDGRLLAISWVGLPEIDYPTDQEGWAHCLSLVKELVVEDKKLYQRPVQETRQLRSGEAVSFTEASAEFYDTQTNRYEVTFTFDALASGTIHLLTDQEQNQGLTIQFDSKRGKMVIDRSHAGGPFGEEYGTTRSFTIAKKALQLQIFVDCSIVEIFINDGETVATLRVFPEEHQTGLHVTCDTNYQGQLWQLRKTNP